jgi:hypothetical protein
MTKSKTVTVSEGRVTGIGKTKAEANADLKSQIKGWCDAPDPHIETRFGHVLIVYYYPSSQCTYMILDPDDLASHGKVYRPTCVACSTMENMISEARNHLAQMVWSPEGDDELHAIRADLNYDHTSQLRSWMKWQRAYSKLVAAGYSATEAHQMACGQY